MKMLLVFLFLFFPFIVFAQPVLINEIAWMGTPVAGVEENQWWRYEWLELYNTGDTVGMLDGWTVELSREKIDFKIPLSGTISTDGYFLIGASDKISNLDLNYKNLGGKFFNGGQKVVLKNSLGEVIDEVDPHYLNLSVGVDAQNGWPAGDNKTKQTMERVVGSDPTTLWQTSADPGGTPKAPNSEGIVSEGKSSLTRLSYPQLNSVKDEVKLSLTKDETEKDLAGSSSLASPQLQSFQGRVPVVNPITLLAGLLALGFSGVLLLAKRLLASRQERQRLEHPERSRRA